MERRSVPLLMRFTAARKRNPGRERPRLGFAMQPRTRPGGRPRPGFRVSLTVYRSGGCAARNALWITAVRRIDLHAFGAVKMTRVVRHFVVLVNALRPSTFVFPPSLDKRLHTEGPPRVKAATAPSAAREALRRGGTSVRSRPRATAHVYAERARQPRLVDALKRVADRRVWTVQT